MISALPRILAEALLSSLPPGLPRPDVVAFSDPDEAVMTWLSAGNRLEASVDGDGFLSWAARVGGAVRPGGSVDLGETASPGEFARALGRFLA